jgi:polyhydroxyalkanoate synthase
MLPPWAFTAHLSLGWFTLLSTLRATHHPRSCDPLFPPNWLSLWQEQTGHLSEQEQQKLYVKIQQESWRRYQLLTAGLQKLHQQLAQPDHRSHKPFYPNAEKIGQLGSSQLYLFPSKQPHMASKEPILFIPSLINKSYLFDFDENISLASLLSMDRPCALVDWNSPIEEEYSFDFVAYIEKRLSVMLEHLFDLYDQRPISVIGHCMGGLLALALAQRHPRLISQVLLLSCPWDFHATPFAQLAAPSLSPADDEVDTQPNQAMKPIMPSWLQGCFYWVNPWKMRHKLMEFAGDTWSDQQKDHFCRIQRWVHDGISLSHPMASNMYQWLGQGNPADTGMIHPHYGQVNSTTLPMPIRIIAPWYDPLIPANCALALAKHVPHSEAFCPFAGHLSLLTDPHVMALYWIQFRQWLNEPRAS